MRRWVAGIAVVLALGGCHAAPRATPSTGVVPLSTVDGASLVRVAMPDGSPAYLQTIDVRAMAIDQVTGARDATRVPAPAAYLPGGDSPAYQRIGTAQMQRSCRDRYGAKAFSAVNFAFFEEYRPSTPLSFPVRSGGAVLSGGSSPYGPVAGAKAAYYRTVTLRALTWDAHGVAIVAYHPDTGTPLTGPTPDAVVTYLYTDHPSYVLDRDPPNRYQLLGLLDGAHLAILTVTHATLADGAKVLARQGVHGDILTFDGGVSTYLWSAAGGELVHITNNDGLLPHYLCVHAR